MTQSYLLTFHLCFYTHKKTFMGPPFFSLRHVDIKNVLGKKGEITKFKSSDVLQVYTLPSFRLLTSRFTPTIADQANQSRTEKPNCGWHGDIAGIGGSISIKMDNVALVYQ